MKIWPGNSYPLGATCDNGGTNFSLFSEVAERVELCLFDEAGRETRVDLPEVTGHCWHGYFPGIAARAALRLPRARPVGTAERPPLQSRQAAARPLRQGHRRRCSAGTRRCSPTASTMARTCATMRTAHPSCRSASSSNPFFDWAGDRQPQRPWHETVIYELHVKGFTARHPDVPPELRGTYAGLAHPAVDRVPETSRRHRGRADAGAPVRPRQAPGRPRAAQLLGLQLDRLSSRRTTSTRPTSAAAAPVAEFKQMVKTLHQAGHRGHPRRGLQPHRRGQRHWARRCRFKGIDNAAYYRLIDGHAATTSTTPAPATASTCATRTCCS